MNEPAASVTVTLRIPGRWSHPREMVKAMPAGYKLTPEALVLPDKTSIELGFRDADDQFAEVFRSACRRPPSPEELAAVDDYKVNVLLSGPGGSLEAARAMMQAGAAFVQAGGAGVLIDNSALAHGGQDWLAMTEDGSPDAVSFAFVAIVQGKVEAWTMGMHILGLPDIVMKRTDIEEGGFDIVEVIRYMAASDCPIGDGHLIGDENGPRFRTVAVEGDPELADSVMGNPFGRLKLMSLKDIAEAN